MRLGIDFGTTRIVVATVDRGNYPIVSFELADGSSQDWLPPLVAVKGSERRYGWDAYAAQTEADWTVVRSLKRVLEDAGPNTILEIGGQSIRLMDLLTGLTRAVYQLLRESIGTAEEKFEVMLGVPANSNTNQRFLTAEAFRLAGFDVIGLLNEPSAASVEYTHKQQDSGKSMLLVYDLGGGTFDASLVEHDDRTHSVYASEGISTLGGDDFDHLIAEMALEAADLHLYQLTQAEMFRLMEECRVRKESLHPNTRRLLVDLKCVRESFQQVSIPVAEFYERAKPYVDETVNLVRSLLDKHARDGVDCLYITGGGSELPIVARLLKDEFGRKVKRSAHTRSATAIGLAIQADAAAGYVLHDRFTRNFGVWREADQGRRIIFDPLFPKGTPLPAAGEPTVQITRRYRPVHNIGHFRFLECSFVTDDAQPYGDITLWDEIQFPFDPGLSDQPDLTGLAVTFAPTASVQTIEESYRCDAAGTVTVSIRNLTSDYERSYPLGRWAVKTKPIAPARKRRNTKSATT